MTTLSDLKSLLHQELNRTDKLLVILATFTEPRSVSDIREQSRSAGLRIPKSWNVSTILGRTKGLAIRTPHGWELSESGKQHLRSNGLVSNPVPQELASDLRSHLDRIQDEDTRAFMSEAIGCYEARFHRAAIVMSWVGAVSILRHIVHRDHLIDFNTALKRMNARSKNVKSVDDFTKIKESEFLDRIASISVIGPDTKRQLNECLSRRNTCGHPNSTRFGERTVAHHIELLLLNVFTQFT